MINHCDWCRDHLRQLGQLHLNAALRQFPWVSLLSQPEAAG